MQLPEPHPFPFLSMVSEIEKGIAKIPQFQRDIVWSKAKSCKLMDSIVKACLKSVLNIEIAFSAGGVSVIPFMHPIIIQTSFTAVGSA